MDKKTQSKEMLRNFTKCMPREWMPCEAMRGGIAVTKKLAEKQLSLSRC